MPFVYVIVALILLVVLHELGHFLAARAVGIRATKFYVFFPPALFKRTVGDVEYGIGAIPAGGFVKLPGMFEPVPGEIAERLRWEYEEIMPLVRDGDLRLRLDAARRAVAHADGPDDLIEPLGEVRDGFATMRDADEERTPDQQRTIEKAYGRVVGMLDDAHPKAYWRASLWRRMTVIFAGPFVNLVIAFVVLTAFGWLLTPRYELDGPLRVEIQANSPAAEAGLDDESRIIGWNGPVAGISPRSLGERVEAGRGEPARITWKDEDGRVHRATIVPERLDGPDSPPLIGAAIRLTSVKQVGRDVTSLSAGASYAVDQMRYITVENMRRLPQVFFDKEIREDVGSVVGIVQFADEVDEAGQIISYVAIISLILAVMNLLPLLPLDGGHLLFGVLEAVRRRPMPRAAFERYSLVGMALVLMLFFIGLDNDITRARG